MTLPSQSVSFQPLQAMVMTIKATFLLYLNTYSIYVYVLSIHCCYGGHKSIQDENKKGTYKERGRGCGRHKIFFKNVYVCIHIYSLRSPVHVCVCVLPLREALTMK
jgi:hypothetical protein